MAKLRKPKRKSTDAEYYAYMEKLAKAKAKEWKRPEDDTLTEMLNDNTYDYRALLDYKPQAAKKALKRNGHFPDTGKTMYHPTFSNQSVYSDVQSDYNPLGIEGGTWVDDHTYRPSLQLVLQYFNADKTLGYMLSEDPKARIVPPKYRTGKSENDEHDVIERLRSEGRDVEADAMLASMQQAEQLRKRNFKATNPTADYTQSLSQQERQVLMQNVKKNEDRKNQILEQIDHALSNRTSNVVKKSFTGLRQVTDSLQQEVKTAKDVADTIAIQVPDAIQLLKKEKTEEFIRHSGNMAKSLELLSAAYGMSTLLGKGTTYLAETGMSPKLFEMYSRNPRFYDFVKNMDKGQVFANTVGGLADGVQSYLGSIQGNTALKLINGFLVPFDAIGAAGGLNLNKYVPRSSKLRPLSDFLDTAADRIGFGSMGYDIVDANDAVSNVLLQRFFEQPADKYKHGKSSGMIKTPDKKWKYVDGKTGYQLDDGRTVTIRQLAPNEPSPYMTTGDVSDAMALRSSYPLDEVVVSAPKWKQAQDVFDKAVALGMNQYAAAKLADSESQAIAERKMQRAAEQSGLIRDANGNVIGERPLEQVSPEFDALLMGGAVKDIAKEIAGKINNKLIKPYRLARAIDQDVASGVRVASDVHPKDVHLKNSAVPVDLPTASYEDGVAMLLRQNRLDNAYRDAVENGDIETANMLHREHFFDIAQNGAEMSHASKAKEPFDQFVQTRMEEPYFHFGDSETADNIAKVIPPDAVGVKDYLLNKGRTLEVPDAGVWTPWAVIRALEKDGKISAEFANNLRSRYPSAFSTFDMDLETAYARQLADELEFDALDYANYIEGTGTKSTAIVRPENIKLTEPTYFKASDPEVLSGEFEEGDLIPLHKRDNFKRNNIRFGLKPVVSAATAAGAAAKVSRKNKKK